VNLSQAQPYIQLEEAMKASSNPSTKPSEDEAISKSAREAPDYVSNRHRGLPPYKKQTLSIMPSRTIQGYRSAECFTPLKLPIDEVFNTFKDQPKVRCLKPIQPNPSLIGSEYCSFYDCKGH